MERSRLRSNLWKDLPSDVLDKILAKLPLSAVMNFSRVFTREFKKLRVPGRSRDLPKMLVGLAVDQETGNYKLVVGFVESNAAGDEEPRGTHIYDSSYSMWTSFSECPNVPTALADGMDEDEDGPSQRRFRPGVSVRSGGKFYWLVHQDNDNMGYITTYDFRFLLKYDIEARSWTIDEAYDLPYEVADVDIFPDCLPLDLPYAHFLNLPKRHPLDWLTLPPLWNFHLSVYEETVFMTLFDSLICTNPYSGQISTLIPEVEVIQGKLVGEFLDCADLPADDEYLPTKAVAQNDTWFIVFEYHGVCRDREDPRPLRVFAYSPNRNVSRWLPELHLHSCCSEILSFRPPHLLPELYTFTATLRAFV
ncbi:hypothetical protein R1sor_026613 [Riccia sorocarpa]|uniref:F-box domain-containing protein n=1 Tax=Riccia sorocarpa TaxID=122646 RepID=A0ABD3GBX8_9MARC